MGNEASSHLSSIGKCCSQEEIDEVIKRDSTQTLDLEETSARTPPGQEPPSKTGTPSSQYPNNGNKMHKPASLTVEEAIIRIQANFRGIITRKFIRQKMTDQTLNSITQSFATASILGERRPDPVRKHVLPDGALYSGQVRRDALSKTPDELIPDGKGKLKWPNGDKYSGRFVGGVPQGDGVKVLVADSTTIQGSFRNGMACGRGKMTRENAQGQIEYCYEGEFLSDKPDGYGTETQSNGNKYEGYFSKGKKGPSGTMWFTDGNIYVGEFKNDTLQGHGKLTNTTKQMSYEGDWQANKMHGMGLYLWDDGRRYQGQYVADKKTGFGAYMWVDGRVYYGMWKDGAQHGEGTIINPNMDMKKALYEKGRETMILELGGAEKTEITQYVQNMRQEREKLLKDKQGLRKSRTSGMKQSRNFEKTRQLQEQARRSTMRTSSAARQSSAAAI